MGGGGGAEELLFFARKGKLLAWARDLGRSMYDFNDGLSGQVEGRVWFQWVARRQRGGCPTGNTRGMPPLTGLEPSSAALELRNKFSLPLLDFHEMMVAPCRSTSMRSPCGREATTRELSSEMVTSGAGAEGEMGISEGFFERSTIVAS